MFLSYHLCLQNFKEIKNQLIIMLSMTCLNFKNSNEIQTHGKKKTIWFHLPIKEKLRYLSF